MSLEKVLESEYFRNRFDSEFRIQFAYRLDPVDLAWGYIMGVQTEVWLTSKKNYEQKSSQRQD